MCGDFTLMEFDCEELTVQSNKIKLYCLVIVYDESRIKEEG